MKTLSTCSDKGGKGEEEKEGGKGARNHYTVLRMAVSPDPRITGVPSTKGTL
jgi:hypothetical protein